MTTNTTPRIIGPTDGKSGVLAAIGVRFMIDREDTDSRFSLVEHPMPARAIAAPLHRHSREDEYSLVLEGRMGHNSDRTSSMPRPATSSSSPATSGTRSGTRVTNPAESSS
jgi:hypothetical protein